MAGPSIFRRDTSEFDRGLGFFDAIFGFAVTLLVVNLDVPEPDAWTSLSTLLSGGVGNQLQGFLISFVVIVAFWRANCRVLAMVRSMDSTIVTINIVICGLIILVPFTTQGISDTGLSDLPLPTALYAVNIALLVVAHQAIVLVARRNGLLEHDIPPSVRVASTLDNLLAAGVFLLSIPVAYVVDPGVAKLCWLSLVVIGPVSGRWVDRRIAEAQALEGDG